MPTMGDQNDTTTAYRLAVRFGDEILQAGFTTVPNLLLRYQAALSISSSEFNFILQVWYHWWDQKDPYPALGTIAERIGQSRRQVRRYSESLRDKGFLIVRERREPGLGQVTSEYDFTPLLDQLRALYREEQIPTGKGGTNLTAPPRTDLTEGGRTFLTEAPRTSMSSEEYSSNNKTQEQEYPTNSNRFEPLASLQKPTTSKFSKKRNAIIQELAANGPVEPAEPKRPASTFQPIGQILTNQTVTRPPKTPAVGPRNGPDSAYYPDPGTRSHPAQETAAKRPRGRPKKYPVPPDLELFTSDITAEFHDTSKLPSNLSFIGRVLHETGLSPSVLYQLMQEARQLTKGRGNIEKTSDDDPGFRNRFPYWRKTLLDLIEKEGKTVSARRRPHAGSP